jgi:hypothetical protein
MAYNDDQKEFPIEPNSNKKTVKSTQFLPRFFRTPTNEKFLESTLDQMIQPGVAEKLSGYIGRQVSKARTTDDNYVGAATKQRTDYQFEPATVIKDDLGNVDFFKDYQDFINQLTAFNSNTADHSNVNAQEFYAWNPGIDWDKFTNFREYYWLPNGPQAVPIAGQSRDVQSTYTVTLEDQTDSLAYIFSPNGFTPNPTLKLYKGQTYKFEINTPDHPFTFSTSRSFVPADPSPEFSQELINVSTLYNDGIKIFDADMNEVDDDWIERGFIEFTVPENAPDKLYYISKNDINISGFVTLYDIEDNTEIDVEAEILGKSTYTTSANYALSNGMKVYFQGDVTPEKYATGEWYVEGVGSKIVLISTKDLEIPAAYSENLLVPFDTEGFDTLPFGNSSSYAGTKDYIVINRASLDRNAWTRYNRWFHRSVIEASAAVNGTIAEIDQTARAKRPIIEFEAGLKLFQFGSKAKEDIDLIDTFTKDVFSTIEGSSGYNIDGVDVSEGQRILFTADTDILVRNKIYEVQFITVEGPRQITLIEVADSNSNINETVLVQQGTDNAGQIYYYNGETWLLGQEKTSVNQDPLFDLFDKDGVSFSDETTYIASNFRGNPVYSYKRGSGIADNELGFALSYRAFENIGDITFDFNLLNETYNYSSNNRLVEVASKTAYIRKYTDLDKFSYVNGWTKGRELSKQKVIRQYFGTEITNNFAVDVYDKSGDLNDLRVWVYKNNAIQILEKDYQINRINQTAFVRFFDDVSADDRIVIKTTSSTPKNENGYYEIASNLERNPLNNNMTEFTLGEVNDHVSSIVEEAIGFDGVFLGTSNLRDLGEVDQYGKLFVKHSGPVNLANYHITSKEHNMVKALRYNRAEYAKFKRVFFQTAFDLGYDGDTRTHVDLILAEMNKSKTNTMPFYFSDMLPAGSANKLEYNVVDIRNEFFALSDVFTLNNLSSRAVLVYLNGAQLMHGRDYTFNDDGFCVITADKELNDKITIYEYDTTDGSYIPPTPTKLGLYPAYRPEIFSDDTYQETQTVIQGHDGSIVVAYGDYRDDLLLELETRIYNNLKQSYNTDILDLTDFVDGEYRDTLYSRNTRETAMVYDFTQWLDIVGSADFTSNTYFERSASFTYNYKYMASPKGNPLPGFWRAVYKDAYDTDRPHSHPWEMLGFTVIPAWWQDVYGPAPYTSNNLVLWEDIEQGIIRQPGMPVRYLEKYARPGILEHLPVDDQGRLLSPLESSYARGYISNLVVKDYTFGDQAPTETAWRRSSEYPFSLITSWIINQPTKVFGVGFDISRIERDLAGHLVYTPSQEQIRLSDLVFPNNVEADQRTLTSGLVNFMYNYLASAVLLSYTTYQNNLTSITNQMAAKIGGFTDKSKFELVLDSKTPFNKSNVLVPKENYNIFLNTSSPVKVVNYSGAIIEKRAAGYIIKGYDKNSPAFKYYKAYELDNDPVINVGGISSAFSEWDERKVYVVGQVVRYAGLYYRTKIAHTSSTNFEDDKFAKLPELPIEGGQTVFVRKKFNKRKEQTLPYGTLLRDIQDVVDFLLGYQEYLTSQGFKFDYFNSDISVTEDWLQSAKEFLFWTTQNWQEGSVITLSPGAFQVKIQSEFSVVDDIFDNFYDYSVYKADGQKLIEDFTNRVRTNENEFILLPSATEDGVFNIKLPLVQKEHVLLLDNRTEFNDIIYDPEAGYRQERIKVVGYRSDNWTGGLNIPGFIYDDARTTQWEENKDYAIGDLVKYKEFYYSANNKVSGSDTFVASDWSRLPGRPESKLRTNFDFKISEFADFYSLDSDNFDDEQQRFAQHLIGYQDREYLKNIINDDISQYKFYQGFIADKGTANSLTKLFDALASADKDSLEFYEEWALRVGQLGAVDKYDEFEYALDEAKFTLSPQPIELTNEINTEDTRLVYKIRDSETYLKSKDYNHAPFETMQTVEEFVPTAGYVHTDDAEFRVFQYQDILDIPFELIQDGHYVWVGKDDPTTWNIYKYTTTDYEIESISAESNSEKRITINKTSDFKEGDIIGIVNVTTGEGFYEVVDLVANSVVVISDNLTPVDAYAPAQIFSDSTAPQEQQKISNGFIARFEKVRFANIAEANDAIQSSGLRNNDTIWIDNAINNNWSVFKNSKKHVEQTTMINPAEIDSSDDGFATAVSASSDNKTVAIGAPGSEIVRMYSRASANNSLVIKESLIPESGIASGIPRFGASVALSPDGKWLLVGSPDASNIKTRYKGVYDENTDYSKNAIVSYLESLWKARIRIDGATSNIEFSTFDSYEEISTRSDSTIIKLLTLGNYNLPDTNVDHLLVRAPLDMFEGVAIGDSVALHWNTYSNTHSDPDVEYQPFGGQINAIDNNFINDLHVIQAKIDHILYVDDWLNLPEVGDTVSTTEASGTISYIGENNGSATIYLNTLNGTFSESGELFVNDTTTVGDYTIPDYDAGAGLGGYLQITTPTYTNTATSYTDDGKGLVFRDVIKDSEVRDTNFYYNILENVKEIGTPATKNEEISFLAVLSHLGNPEDALSLLDQLDSRWVIRTTPALGDALSASDTFRMFVNDTIDITSLNFLPGYFDNELTVNELWDGYIDFQFTEFQTIDTDFDGTIGDPYEPSVGDIVRDATTGATAEVTYYQRVFNNIRIYVKSVTGTWSNGSFFGDSAEIIRQGSPSRTMGIILQTSIANDTIGKLIVVDTNENIEIPVVDVITDEEYWFYTELFNVTGIPRLPNLPASNNSDWEQVYNIEVTEFGEASSYVNQGMYSVYEKNSAGIFDYKGSYTTADSVNNSRFGEKIRMTKHGDLYTAFVSSGGNDTIDNSGKIHYIFNGTRDGITYNWERGKDRNYRGEFKNSVFYREGEIVNFESNIYVAITNIAPGNEFDATDWELTEGDVSYLGFIPNNPEQNINDEIFSPAGGIVNFAYDFDVSSKGDVIAVASKLTGNDSVKKSSVEIYRRLGDHFVWSQTIPATADNTGYGESVGLSGDGMMIAVGEPYNDARRTDQGRVYVYAQVDGAFELTQTLYSTSNEEAEQFGYKLSFDNTQLAITSLAGDIKQPTTFDQDTTYFDKRLTRYTQVEFDTGLVQLYERINDTLLHAASFAFDDMSTDLTFFGENVVVNDNHVYIGVPRALISDAFEGMMIDYRRPKTENAWTLHREPVDPVNISTIKSSFLYNKRLNEYLTSVDYIDPIQGKIAGIADQDITYKTKYDPAIYNLDTDLTGVVLDGTDHWAERYIGRVWWDLSTALFINPYQDDVVYQTNTWNKLFTGASIDIYEWVESDVIPSVWDSISGTDEGLARGISGTSKYGDSAYTIKTKYNSVTKTFSEKYYFWVIGKVTVPRVEFRSINTVDIAALISNPFGQRYRFVSLLADNKFAVNNLETFLENTDVVINFQKWKLDNKEMNIHTEYQLLTDGLKDSKPKRDIEAKWFDSLVGKDRFFRDVPDPELSPKVKYGTLNNPRQSWFVNRNEALKQVIEHTNAVLKENLVVDTYDISLLDQQDPAPTATTNTFDTTVDSIDELTTIGTARLEKAVLSPVIVDGQITRVDIVSAGRGYTRVPTYELVGKGIGAEFEITINGIGQIIDVSVTEQGSGYDESTAIIVRSFSALVNSDATIANKWSVYSWNQTLRQWERRRSQEFDITAYWEYIDWYAETYNEFTEIAFTIDEAYELTALTDKINDIVKIRNVGSGGWLLLRKIDNQDTVDYSVNYETIGRQNGTIKFLSTLYDPSAGQVGYDVSNFDITLYDSEPVIETRKILEILRDNILVNDLEIEYNKLFFVSLRYVFSEQGYVDWAFKTSFVKAQHNVGELTQKVTFQNDNLPSYEEYINEVKPYKTKIREYVSSYEGFDSSQSVVTDFDLFPSYSNEVRKIIPHDIKIRDNELIGVTDRTRTNPFKQWLDAVGFEVTEIKIKDGGTGYTQRPIIKLIGGGGSGATARAFVSSGRINKIEITNPGSGYTSAPTVEIQDIQGSGTARATAVLGGSPIRGTHIAVKFDRTSGSYYITNINETDTFTASGSQLTFDLEYPLDLRTTTVEILINDQEALRSEFTFKNVLDTSKGYDRYQGRITFTEPPALNATVTVNYKKNISMLQAQDRVNFFYNPVTGQYGKDLSQLMNGIDYGGVEVKSFGFSRAGGWDVNPWYSEAWDTYDTTFEDEIFTLDGSTITVELSKPLEDGVQYNIYRNGVRIDEDSDSSFVNPNALTATITGDGSTDTIDLQDKNIPTVDGDIIIIRKSTSDGSFVPDPSSYDTLLSGGDLAYTTAKGIAAEQIIVDGDGFVTPTTSQGPEELVPGQILDTLDIQVYDKTGDGGSNIYVANFASDGATDTFELGIKPNSTDAVFVRFDNVIQDSSSYTINWENNTVDLNSVPSAGTQINIVVLGEAGARILDIKTFTGDGSTLTFNTAARFNNDLTYKVLVDGVETEVTLTKNVKRNESQFIADGTNSIILDYNPIADTQVFVNGVQQLEEFYQTEIEVDEFGDNVYKILFVNNFPSIGSTIVVYDGSSNVDINFAEAPEPNADIRCVIYQDTTDGFSTVKLEEFTGDGSTIEYILAQAPFTSTPLRYNVLVEVDGNMLSAGYTYRTILTEAREYIVEQWQVAPGSEQTDNVEVYLNGIKLEQSVEWQWDTFNSAVMLFGDVGLPGDELVVYIIDDGEYTLEGSTLTLDTAPGTDAKIKVWQFSNHNILDIKRKTYTVITRAPVTEGTVDYITYQDLTNGIVKLFDSAIDAQYVWVSINGELLSPLVDYSLSLDNNYIKVKRAINENDVIDIMQFTANVSTTPFGYRQFKDMLNRTHYKRIDDSSAYTLAADLNWYDLRIELTDASSLPTPSKESNIPGVLFVNGERIEYFLKEGNTLRQIRRGTLGTGVKEVYEAGTVLHEQGPGQTIPYTDRALSQTFPADGVETDYRLDFVTDSVNDMEVFVAGRRLRKGAISVFDNTVAQDSPEGDVTLPAEFVLSSYMADDSTEVTDLVLAEAPAENVSVTVVRKVGKIWTEQGISLRYADNDIGRFIRAKTVALPE